MSTKRKPVLGETLFSLNVGNAARHAKPVLTPMKVVSVGHKYFTLSPVQDDRRFLKVMFHKESWRQKTEYSCDHELYETEQEWKDVAEHAALSKQIGEAFRYGHSSKSLSLETLRAIANLINQSNKPHSQL